MARSTRSAKLETRTARLRLKPRKKPYTVRIAPGVRLGYRRNETAGSWSVIAADGSGGSWMKSFAVADDFDEANGARVLDFWQAQTQARVLARKDAGEDDGRPPTVAQALDRYELDLRARGGDIYNAQRVRVHLSSTLAAKPVALLTAHELHRWRDSLIAKGLAPATINRTRGALQAAFELAATQDSRIVNRNAWRKGLASLPDAQRARNVILPDTTVRAIIEAAHAEGREFGLLIETAAVTGARVSQLARLEVGDLQADRSDPRLMMPSSLKGRGRKHSERRPVPIPIGLAALLSQARRPAGSSRLLVKPSGEPWKPNDHQRRFARVIRRLGLDDVTIYALRHSSIVRQLLANVPIRLVATMHDTSVGQIEQNYSRHILDHSDVMLRRALLDAAQPAASNVVTLPQAKV